MDLQLLVVENLERSEHFRQGFSLVSSAFAQVIRSEDITILSFPCVHHATEFLVTAGNPTGQLRSIAPKITTIRFEFPLYDLDDLEEVAAEDFETWVAFWSGFETTFHTLVNLQILNIQYLHSGSSSALSCLAWKESYLPRSLRHLHMLPVASDNFDGVDVSPLLLSVLPL